MRFILILFFLFYSDTKLEVGGEFSFEPPKVYPSKPKYFNYIYQQVRKMEGCYVYHPNDRGGETYGGIARRYHPDWYGWKYVDEAKPLQRHDTVRRAELWVKDWYLSKWVNHGFEVIENREVVWNLFDFVIHSSPRTVEIKVNNVLKKLGCKPVKVQGEWVDERFNRVPPTEFILLLKIERLKLFNYLVTKNPSQRVFYLGWIRRLEHI